MKFLFILLGTILTLNAGTIRAIKVEFVSKDGKGNSTYKLGIYGRLPEGQVEYILVNKDTDVTSIKDIETLVGVSNLKEGWFWFCDGDYVVPIQFDIDGNVTKTQVVKSNGDFSYFSLPPQNKGDIEQKFDDTEPLFKSRSLTLKATADAKVDAAAADASAATADDLVPIK